MNKAADKPCKYLCCDNEGENELYVQQVLCAENDIQLEMTAPNTTQMNGVMKQSLATCKDRAFATMFCARISSATQGLLWPEGVNTIAKIGNSFPRPGLANDPHTAWFGFDAKVNRILGQLQPFGRIAYVTNRNTIKAKLDVCSTKCVFVGYAVDHSGDTYKFYNPLTKSTILPRDVHQWMEWHGRTTATDDWDLFTELKKLKMDSVILPAPQVVPILTDADLPDDSALLEVPALAPIAEDVPAAQASTSVVPPARRNLTSSFGQGAVTSSRGHQGVVTCSQVRHVTFADVGHRSNDTAATSPMDIEDWTDILVMNTSLLQSDPSLGVPKNSKELMKLNYKAWLKSLNGKLEYFLSQDAWEFLPRHKMPQDCKTLRCCWIFRLKIDGSKKSCSVVRGRNPGWTMLSPDPH
jgi:hypothetical protein